MKVAETKVKYEWKSADSIREEKNKLYWLNNIWNTSKPRLIIDSRFAFLIKELHRNFPSEERLAKCRVVNNEWVLYLDWMIFPEQTRSGWECETTQEWANWSMEYLMEQEENLEDWNCILHSHHHMGCFWSWTDNSARLGLNDWREFSISIVTAYSGEDVSYKGCINFYTPYNIEIDLDIVPDNTLIEEFDRRVANASWYKPVDFDVVKSILGSQYELIESELVDNYENKMFSKVMTWVRDGLRASIEEELWVFDLCEQAVADIKERTKSKYKYTVLDNKNYMSYTPAKPEYDSPEVYDTATSWWDYYKDFYKPEELDLDGYDEYLKMIWKGNIKREDDDYYDFYDEYEDFISYNGYYGNNRYF